MRTPSHTDLALSRRVALFGILGALTLVLGLLDNLISAEAAFLPMGTRLGLSNICLVLAAQITPAGGFCILALKVAFAFVTRGASAAAMSFCGGLPATAVTVLLLLLKKRNARADVSLSYIGVAVSGAVCHNIGQLACACVMTGTAALVNYGKYLIIFALVSGTVTGVVLNLLAPAVMRVVNTKKHMISEDRVKNTAERNDTGA